MLMKICPRCKVEKSELEFGFRLGRVAQLRTYCRLCQAQYTREWEKKHPLDVTRWRRNRSTSGRLALSWKRYADTHREELRMKEHVRYYTNKGREIRRTAGWLAKHPEWVRAGRRLRAATAWYRKGHVSGEIGYTIRRLWWFQEGCCYYCHQTLDILTFVLDHMIPRSRGGGSSGSNLALACAQCNRIKANKTAMEIAGT